MITQGKPISINVVEHHYEPRGPGAPWWVRVLQRPAFWWLTQLGCRWENVTVPVRYMRFVHQGVGEQHFEVKLINRQSRHGFSLFARDLEPFIDQLAELHGNHILAAGFVEGDPE